MSEWDTPPLRLCIFDTRRGQEEGHELDKILFFFPAECPLPVQLSVIGLSEGLITFTTIFSPEVPCELIESERQSHILYQPESDIWMVMVVNKGKEDDEVTRDTALQVVLKEAYCLFQMFYGSIRELLQQNPDGVVARTCLYAFLPDYLADFMGAKKLRLSLIQESLAERGTIQMFSLERETALEVQSLVNLLEFWFGGGKIRHTLIIFRDLLVSTTMPPATPKIAKLEKRLSKEWGGSNMYHVPGYRYLHVDHESKVSRASPQSKVGTLSKDSLTALNRLRAEFDVAKSRAGRKESDVFHDYEACVRTKNNAWVVVRIREGHELYMVLERASDALLLTSEAVEIFNKRYCNDIFLSD
eukprot:c29013_g2_i3 orf=630-1703(-)